MPIYTRTIARRVAIMLSRVRCRIRCSLRRHAAAPELVRAGALAAMPPPLVSALRSRPPPRRQRFMPFLSFICRATMPFRRIERAAALRRWLPLLIMRLPVPFRRLRAAVYALR